MYVRKNIPYPMLWMTWLLIIWGCATFNPRPVEEVSFLERAQTQVENNVRVTAAVLSPEESEALFDVPLYKKGIQPIWLEIENTDEEPVLFLPVSIDPEYFPPLEVAYMHRRGFSKTSNKRMEQYFHEHFMGQYIPPGDTRSGFVFTHLDLGTKIFNVDLVGQDHQIRTFTFVINVPGLRADHHDVDWDDLYSESEIVSHDEAGLRRALERLPCCVTNQEGTKQGNPINVVFIGKGIDVLHALVRSGWNETESTAGTPPPKNEPSSSVWRRFRYSPVTPRYLFGRSQDAAFRKNRETASEQNELRLWLSPLTLEGEPVWVGQVSRDVGLRVAGKVVIRKIEPSMDATRTYMLQSLWYGQALWKYAYVKGVGETPITSPRQNIRGDRYFTDGYRLVLWPSSEPMSFTDVEFVEWGMVPAR